jgi:hypothetical protein
MNQQEAASEFFVLTPEEQLVGYLWMMEYLAQAHNVLGWIILRHQFDMAVLRASKTSMP